MAVLKCKMCGGDLTFEEGSTVCECEYCGSRQTIPNVDDEKKANLFNRANRLRMNNEFDKASAVYESIVAEFPEEAEAYWGLCLCNYGIEYVDDPADGRKLPTCHRTMTGSIMEDANFEQACDCADAIARRVYRDEAKAIDRIQKDILSIAANEKPYDVFICYKETAEEGGRTEDSVLAQDIYDALTAKGMKVFFSRITLEDKLGVMYEPYIFAALSSAKVMLAIGTKFEYYDAVWVKNEWSRYLSMMKTDKTKTLIPCFKDLDAYDMPKEFKGLQAQDMGKLGWLQDLVRGVEKLCGNGSTAEQTVQQTIIQQVSSGGPNAAALLDRGNMALEDGKFKEAKSYFNQVLSMDARCAEAYLGIAMAKAESKNLQALGTKIANGFEPDSEYGRAKQFAAAELKNKLEGYETENQDRLRRIEEKALVKKKRLEEAQAKRENEIKEIKEKLEAINAGKYVPNANDESELTELKRKADQAKEEYIKAQAAFVAAPEAAEQKRILEEIAAKRNQIAGLGIFKGKEKKSLQEQIASLEAELKKALAAVAEKKQEAERKKNAYSMAQSSLEAPLRDRLDILQNAKIGGTFDFGRYEAGTGIQPIRWRVIDIDEQGLLLISDKAIDCKKYNESYTEVTWENCTLRKWLNGDFLKNAFSEEEQNSIRQTTVTADKNPEYSTDPGNDSTDKVFLLSITEAEEYFSSDESRKCMPTAYAIAQGANRYTIGREARCLWWLRSPGSRQVDAASVNRDGPVLYSGYGVGNDSDCVRPALWINLDS